MKQKLFTILAAISLLLCVATSALWIRSYWRTDELCNSNLTGNIEFTPRRIASNRGRIRLYHLRGMSALAPPAGALFKLQYGAKETDNEDWISMFRDSQVKSDEHRLFGYFADAQIVVAVFPHWLPVILFAILPTVWFMRSRRDQLALVGRCQNCGYDLRATPERCPECGMQATMKAER